MILPLIGTISALWFIIGVLVLIFVIVQFVHMIKARMPKKEKGLWILLFIVASLLTAIVWYFVKGKK